MELLVQADGHLWTGMHAVVSPRRIASATGLVWFAKKMGVIGPAAEHEAGGTATRYLLGASQQTYIALDRTTAINNFRQFFGMGLELSWLASSQVADVRAFAEKASQAFEVAFGKRARYGRQQFVRKMLLAGEAALDANLLDGLTMQQILKWAPDERNFCGVLGDMSGSEVRQRLGMSALSVPAWACLFWDGRR